MEIRPYRSQVRETATREPLERPNTAMAQTYAAYGDMISRAGDTASSSLYKWNDAIEKRRDQDRKIAYQAGVQEMDVLFAELGKAMDDDMAKREQDPFSVFDADTKNALNEVYTYHVNTIKDRTVGRAADPETKAMLELYFRAKKLEAGASVETAIKAHTDNVAATVMGRANAGLVETAIAGDEKDIETSMKGIKQNLDILAERGVITRAQIAVDLKGAKDQIEFGRAKNQIDALDYKTGQEFVNQVPVNDETRKNLQTYFKDRWDRQKNIWEQEAGATFEQGLDMYNKGTLTREWVYAQKAFELHPELGIKTDFRKILIGLLDDQDKAGEEVKNNAREAANRKYRVQIDKGDNIDKVWQNILYDPDLKASDVDTLGNLIAKKQGGTGTAGSIAKVLDINPILAPITNNYYAGVNAKLELVGQMEKAKLITPDEGAKIRKIINSKELYVDARIETRETELAKRRDGLVSVITSSKSSKKEKKEAQEQLNILNEVSKSLLLTIADNIDVEEYNTREQNIERALKTLDDAIRGVDVLGIISGRYSGNDPVIDADNDGNYEIKFEKSYTNLKDREADAYDLRMTGTGETWMTQVTQPETETLAKITGNDPGDFAIVFSSDNNGFYYNSRKEDKQYRFVKNENGNYTIEERHPVEINGKMYASVWEPVKAEKKPQVLPGVEEKSPLEGVPLFGHKVINGMTEEEYQNWTNRFKGQN